MATFWPRYARGSSDGGGRENSNTWSGFVRSRGSIASLFGAPSKLQDTDQSVDYSHTIPEERHYPQFDPENPDHCSSLPSTPAKRSPGFSRTLTPRHRRSTEIRSRGYSVDGGDSALKRLSNIVLSTASVFHVNKEETTDPSPESTKSAKSFFSKRSLRSRCAAEDGVLEGVLVPHSSPIPVPRLELDLPTTPILMPGPSIVEETTDDHFLGTSGRPLEPPPRFGDRRMLSASSHITLPAYDRFAVQDLKTPMPGTNLPLQDPFNPSPERVQTLESRKGAQETEVPASFKPSLLAPFTANQDAERNEDVEYYSLQQGIRLHTRDVSSVTLVGNISDDRGYQSGEESNADIPNDGFEPVEMNRAITYPSYFQSNSQSGSDARLPNNLKIVDSSGTNSQLLADKTKAQGAEAGGSSDEIVEALDLSQRRQSVLRTISLKRGLSELSIKTSGKIVASGRPDRLPSTAYEADSEAENYEPSMGPRRVWEHNRAIREKKYQELMAEDYKSGAQRGNPSEDEERPSVQHLENIATEGQDESDEGILMLKSKLAFEDPNDVRGTESSRSKKLRFAVEAINRPHGSCYDESDSDPAIGEDQQTSTISNRLRFAEEAIEKRPGTALSDPENFKENLRHSDGRAPATRFDFRFAVEANERRAGSRLSSEISTPDLPPALLSRFPPAWIPLTEAGDNAFHGQTLKPLLEPQGAKSSSSSLNTSPTRQIPSPYPSLRAAERTRVTVMTDESYGSALDTPSKTSVPMNSPVQDHGRGYSLSPRPIRYPSQNTRLTSQQHDLRDRSAQEQSTKHAVNPSSLPSFEEGNDRMGAEALSMLDSSREAQRASYCGAVQALIGDPGVSSVVKAGGTKTGQSPGAQQTPLVIPDPGKGSGGQKRFLDDDAEIAQVLRDIGEGSGKAKAATSYLPLELTAEEINRAVKQVQDAFAARRAEQRVSYGSDYAVTVSSRVPSSESLRNDWNKSIQYDVISRDLNKAVDEVRHSFVSLKALMGQSPDPRVELNFVGSSRGRDSPFPDLSSGSAHAIPTFNYEYPDGFERPMSGFLSRRPGIEDDDQDFTAATRALDEAMQYMDDILASPDTNSRRSLHSEIEAVRNTDSTLAVEGLLGVEVPEDDVPTYAQFAAIESLVNTSSRSSSGLAQVDLPSPGAENAVDETMRSGESCDLFGDDSERDECTKAKLHTAYRKAPASRSSSSEEEADNTAGGVAIDYQRTPKRVNPSNIPDDSGSGSGSGEMINREFAKTTRELQRAEYRRAVEARLEGEATRCSPAKQFDRFLAASPLESRLSYEVGDCREEVCTGPSLPTPPGNGKLGCKNESETEEAANNLVGMRGVDEVASICSLADTQSSAADTSVGARCSLDRVVDVSTIEAHSLKLECWDRELREMKGK